MPFWSLFSSLIVTLPVIHSSSPWSHRCPPSHLGPIPLREGSQPLPPELTGLLSLTSRSLWSSGPICACVEAVALRRPPLLRLRRDLRLSLLVTMMLTRAT